MGFHRGGAEDALRTGSSVSIQRTYLPIGPHGRRISAAKRHVFSAEMRYRHADGAIHWARQHGTGIRDANGRVVRVVGSTGDISAEKTLERPAR